MKKNSIFIAVPFALLLVACAHKTEVIVVDASGAAGGATKSKSGAVGSGTSSRGQAAAGGGEGGAAVGSGGSSRGQAASGGSGGGAAVGGGGGTRGHGVGGGGESGGGSGGGGMKVAAASRVVALGVWSGEDKHQRITLKISSNGHLVFTNAAGDNAGQWEARGGDQFTVMIGGSTGVFTMLDQSTATLKIGGATVEMRRR